MTERIRILEKLHIQLQGLRRLLPIRTSHSDTGLEIKYVEGKEKRDFLQDVRDPEMLFAGQNLLDTLPKIFSLMQFDNVSDVDFVVDLLKRKTFEYPGYVVIGDSHFDYVKLGEYTDTLLLRTAPQGSNSLPQLQRWTSVTWNPNENKVLIQGLINHDDPQSDTIVVEMFDGNVHVYSHPEIVEVLTHVSSYISKLQEHLVKQ